VRLQVAALEKLTVPTSTSESVADSHTGVQVEGQRGPELQGAGATGSPNPRSAHKDLNHFDELLDRRLRDLEESLRNWRPLPEGSHFDLSSREGNRGPSRLGGARDVASLIQRHPSRNQTSGRIHGDVNGATAISSLVKSVKRETDYGREMRMGLLKEMLDRERQVCHARSTRPVRADASIPREGSGMAVESPNWDTSSTTGRQALFRSPADFSLSKGTGIPNSPIALPGRIDLSNLGKGMGQVESYLGSPLPRGWVSSPGYPAP